MPEEKVDKEIKAKAEETKKEETKPLSKAEQERSQRLQELVELILSSM